MTVELLCGDSAEMLALLRSDSVDLTVTSPPYDNLREYKGFVFDFEAIAKELYRVTKPGGVVVWVVGDATVKGSETGTSFKQALYFKECGFNLHDTMIWYKSNPPPQTKEGRRYTSAHEYMFVLGKGQIKTFNKIMQPCKGAGGITNNKTRQREDRVEARRGLKIKEEKPLQSVVLYANTGYKHHPAAFPEALARDHILSWSNPGDTVLDPFLGSGTTGKMAVLLNRNFIGIEISEEYLAIARERIKRAELLS